MSKKVPLIQATRANRPRNAFDLSQKHLFTSTVGLLQPVLTLDLIPHDHVEIQASDFMRCLPMNSAAFCSLRGVYEFFAVPVSQLYHPFDQFITGMTDFRSNMFDHSKDYSTIPCCELGQIIDFVDKMPVDGPQFKGSVVDTMGFPEKYNIIRMLDMLGYGRYWNADGSKLPVHTEIRRMKVNPLRVCALNKIYYDFYRNSTYEGYWTHNFNIDDLYSTPELSAETFVTRFLQGWYRNAEVDLFTNVRPSPLYDDENFFKSYLSAIPASASATGFTQDDVLGVSIETGGKGTQLLSTSDIRGAFALDKLLQVTQRAGKSYAEQIKAHFGYEVSEGRDGRCVYLGGFDSDIQIGDVTQQSGTSSVDAGVIKHAGYLGRVTGKGTASGSGRIVFDAKEHCILMCIYSVVPNVQYDSTRVDPFVRKNTRGDYFVPEFEDLGLQPVDTISFNVADFKAIGYQPRYSEYKSALDVNHGQFIQGAPLSYWTMGRHRAKESFSSWDVASLKINPRWLNSIFAVDYNGKEVTDFLFGGCNFRIQKVSDMSEQGVPRV